MWPTRSAIVAAAFGMPGDISPMKSDSIWKSMSSASGLLRQSPDCGRLHSAQDVVARHLVGVPQLISGVGERVGKPLGRARQRRASR